MLAGGVAAKPSHCRKDCKQEIRDCLALVPKNEDCTGTRAEKRACRKMHAAERTTCHNFVKLCKQQEPGTSGICLPSSTTTTRPPATTTTTTLVGGSGPVTDLHYASNNNFDSTGNY